MRGTRRDVDPVQPAAGIIPAYAGNTPPAPPENSPTRDHPRVCGEHRYCGKGGPVSNGSSPRMRGTPFGFADEYFKLGIIPAYAGNTSTPFATPPAPRDHPRVCGEHYCVRLSNCGFKGSSPRMRGTPSLPPTLILNAGIIPAYAGNTRPSAPRD